VAERYFGDLPASSDRPDMVDLALQLIDEHSSPFKAEVYKNSYEVALLDLIKEKSKGQKIRAPEAEVSRPSGRNVVDLMDALKKSVTGRKSVQAAPDKTQRQKGRLIPNGNLLTFF
jgi:DNA end-binding protein Ku